MDVFRRLIGLAGGIGSGKSVVSRLLRLKGFSVYDCDSRARCLMEESSEIKCRIRDEISPAVTDGHSFPDRRLLADLVFHDHRLLQKLNKIVHGEVRVDLRRETEKSDAILCFVEAAVMASSGLAEMCDEIWVVEAPLSQRMQSVMTRDSIDEAGVRARMRAQESEMELLGSYEWKLKRIKNGSDNSLLEQVEALIHASAKDGI